VEDHVDHGVSGKKDSYRPGSVGFSDIGLPIVHSFAGEWPITEIAMTRHNSTLNISETIQDRRVVTTESVVQTTNRTWSVAYWTVALPMTLIDIQGHSAIFVWRRCSLLVRSLIESPGDLTEDDIADDLEWPFKVVISRGFIVSKIQHVMYNCIVCSYNSRVSYTCSRDASWLCAI